MSVSGKGRVFTEEHKRKISLANKGRRRTPEQCKRNKEVHKGLQAKEKHPLWKGGISSIATLIRTSEKMIEWRNAVFKRDNYCDWFSGCKGNGNLQAHHIIPWRILLKKYNIKTFEEAMNCSDLWDTNNGMTMLNTNHTAYHQMWG